jgi:hypothetical protein
MLIVFEGERKYFEIPEDVITSLNDVRYSENCEPSNTINMSKANSPGGYPTFP